MKKIIKYSWKQFDRDVSLLSERILPFKKEIKNIYGIPRGGLVLAVALSHSLDIPLITNQKEITQKTLVVDDISDTGKTLLKIKKGLVATLWVCNTTKVWPAFTVNEKEEGDWIKFAWELKK